MLPMRNLKRFVWLCAFTISSDIFSDVLRICLCKCPCNFSVQVMVACFEVFQTWEDEYEKLQVLLRDIVKRKREENLKMVWRLSPAHRKLQSRLDHMRRFRRQHEQLRAVIVRVLRPQVWYLKCSVHI